MPLCHYSTISYFCIEALMFKRVGYFSEVHVNGIYGSIGNHRLRNRKQEV